MNPRAATWLRRGLLLGGVALVGALAIPATSGAESNAKEVKVAEWDFGVKAPKRFPKGDVVLKVHNNGPADHELYIVRGSKELPIRPDGLTVDEEKIEHNIVAELEAGRASDDVRTLHVKLKPGRYEMFCNMSGHYLGGMHGTFVVKR